MFLIFDMTLTFRYIYTTVLAFMQFTQVVYDFFIPLSLKKISFVAVLNL